MLSNIQRPTIIGDPSTIGNTLTASPGGWLGDSGSYTYQWRHDGSPIPGATTNSYALTADDAGHLITVTVVASDGVTGMPLAADSVEVVAGSLPPNAPIADEPDADTEA
jgi:hypothetical protein